MQSVERMEELFLSLNFAGKELNIINQQNVNIPVTALEFLSFIVTNRVNEFVSKFFRTYITNF